MAKIKNLTPAMQLLATKDGKAITISAGETVEADFDTNYLQALLSSGAYVLAEEPTKRSKRNGRSGN